MISIIVSHHDEAFVGLDVHVLHPREELAEYAELSRKHGVKLELETWHTGSIWNIDWMIEQGLLDPPYFTSHLLRLARRLRGARRPSRSTCTGAGILPEGCVATVSRDGPGSVPAAGRRRSRSATTSAWAPRTTRSTFRASPRRRTRWSSRSPASPGRSAGRRLARRGAGADRRAGPHQLETNATTRAVHEPGGRQGRARLGRSPGHRAGHGRAVRARGIRDGRLRRRRARGPSAPGGWQLRPLRRLRRGRRSRSWSRASTPSTAVSTSLANVAGIVLVKPLVDTEWDEFRRIVDVNLGGIFLTVKHVVPVMERQGGGVIVNLGSVSGHVGQVDHSLYGATKGAVIGARARARLGARPEEHPGRIVSPGSVDTAMLRSDIQHRGERDRPVLRRGEEAPRGRAGARALGRPVGDRRGDRLPRQRQGVVRHRRGPPRRLRVGGPMTDGMNDFPALGFDPQRGRRAAARAGPRPGCS